MPIEPTAANLVADATALASRLDLAKETLARIAQDLIPAPTNADQGNNPPPSPHAEPIEDVAKYPLCPGRSLRAPDDERPHRYSECLALGLGVSRPCPYYSCAAHLGLYVLGDGEIRVLIPPDEIENEKHTCVHEAASRAWAPVEIAAQLRVSLGLVELIQRHGVAKTGSLLTHVKDEARACEVDVDGLVDCRSG